MREINPFEFVKKIALEFGVDGTKKYKTFFSQFPIKNGKKKISSSADAIIVDAIGNEFPYMLNPYQRNNDKLKEFDFIYVIRSKGLNEIINETGALVKTEICKICEGGGWYSWGTKYTYGDVYCEI
ncbi:hypothetical protein [Chryseobacterium sp. HR92]|uniref:hypothetical protein n=1 Tax=Chryseobacterium sp. HR92 TaxID=3094839 RepID=UPI003890E46E|nr:hypothetical protein SFA27_16885 [Chryseobacterium sp. HR92]